MNESGNDLVEDYYWALLDVMVTPETPGARRLEKINTCQQLFIEQLPPSPCLHGQLVCVVSNKRTCTSLSFLKLHLHFKVKN